MEIIALLGANGSGKTTIATMIKKMMEEHGDTAAIESFATPLKIIAQKFCGYDEDQKRNGHRLILETLAETIREQLGQGVFAYALLDRSILLNADYIIIDDLRYPEELELIMEFYPFKLILVPYSGRCEHSDIKRLTKLLDYIDERHLDLDKPLSFSSSELSCLVYGSNAR